MLHVPAWCPGGWSGDERPTFHKGTTNVRVTRGLLGFWSWTWFWALGFRLSVLGHEWTNLIELPSLGQRSWD